MLHLTPTKGYKLYFENGIKNNDDNYHKGWWSALMYVIDLPLDEKTSMADVLSMIQSLLDAGASINYETEVC